MFITIKSCGSDKFVHMIYWENQKSLQQMPGAKIVKAMAQLEFNSL